MANPPKPLILSAEEELLKKQCEHTRSRLADMRATHDESPYKPLADRILLHYPLSSYAKAVQEIVETELRKSPNPHLLPQKSKQKFKK